MSKKLSAILVAMAVAATGLFGCSDSKIDNKSGSTGDSVEEEYDLVVASYSLDDSYSQSSYIDDSFAEEHGLKIKHITYSGDENINKLDIMLMAQDTDVDIFFASVLDVAKYVRLGYYEDLKQYDNLKEKIESNVLVDYVSNYDGTCFGVPSFPQYDNKHIFMYASPKFLTYCFENVDGFEGTYADPDGEELYEVFKYMYENDGDKVEYPLEEVDYKVADCAGYVMMSPFSKHKDTAALYLEFMFDYYRDFEFKPYPDLGDVDLEGTYLTWRSTHYKICAPLYDAINNELMKTDGSEKALRKLAKETADHVLMRLQG